MNDSLFRLRKMHSEKCGGDMWYVERLVEHARFNDYYGPFTTEGEAMKKLTDLSK